MMFDEPLRFPDGLDASGFLKEYWQKQPLLLPAAFPNIESPLTGDELAGLACEPDVESRVVVTNGNDYELHHGPFVTDDFRTFPESGWTLLVQDVDKHLPDLATVFYAFDFLPSWRIDDLMISYAAPGGSVGPQVGSCDVFLIQVDGSRRWEVSKQKNLTECGEDLKRVEGFVAEEQWTLKPGDTLYLPPGIAHHGVAESECVTWAIGFRAPGHAELVGDFVNYIANRIDPSLLYSDADLTPGEVSDGLISKQALRRVTSILTDGLGYEPTDVADWFGRFITEPKLWLRARPPADSLNPDDVRERVGAGEALWRHGMTLMARCEEPKLLFVDGENIRYSEQLGDLTRLLCSKRRLGADELSGWIGSREALGLLTDLCNRGALLFDRDL